MNEADACGARRLPGHRRPCVLPILPVLLGATIGPTGRWRPAFVALGFAMAFCVVGAAVRRGDPGCGRFARGAARCSRHVLLAVRAVDAVAAASMAGDAPERPGQPGAWRGRPRRQRQRGGFLLGMTLGAVWTPCAGPVLGSTLTLIATSAEPAEPPCCWPAFQRRRRADAGDRLRRPCRGTRVRAVARHARRCAGASACWSSGWRLAKSSRSTPWWRCGCRTFLRWRGSDSDMQHPLLRRRPSDRPCGPRCGRTPGNGACIAFARLHDYGAAPEFTGITAWFNTPENR